ncbi:MAG: acyl-CoA desaturase, partial [Roseobacter sp.]
DAINQSQSIWVATERVRPVESTSPVDGIVRVSLVKAAWFLGHGIAGVTGLLLFPQFDAFLLFIGLTGLTVCAGHSVGMHRLLIHRSFEVPRWLEYVLVWLGVLVGMAGPFGMIHAHDLRDWHQRQTVCPPHPSHGAGFWKDAWWQLCCCFRLKSPPNIVIEDNVQSDRFYRLLEYTWMAQQLPVAVVLFALGGWAWVLWGISLRIFISLSGHWIVGHFAHRTGHQGWQILDLPVQGYNLPGLGLITFGENWHGNHHAFPHSAKLGIEDGQLDPGFQLIAVLKRVGLATNVMTPNSLPARQGLEKVPDKSA